MNILKKFLQKKEQAAVMGSFTSQQPRLLNMLGQPTGQADEFLFEYLSLNAKALAGHLAWMLKERVATLPTPEQPVFAGLISKVSTQADLESDWSRFWIRKLGYPFLYHRKHWELSFVLQVLYERDMLRTGRAGLGLGCGEEPLPCFLASKGCIVTAGDKPLKDDGTQSGWQATAQYTNSLDVLFKREYMGRQDFEQRVGLQYVDMNVLPEALHGKFDFCWSVCVVEHLGSIRAGLDFLKNSLKLLKPGGVSVHTTEFNYLDTPATLDNWGAVLFHKKHVLELRDTVEELGGTMTACDFDWGCGVFDKYMDLPPYAHQPLKSVQCLPPDFQPPHIKLLVDGFPATCFGVIIQKH